MSEAHVLISSGGILVLFFLTVVLPATTGMVLSPHQILASFFVFDFLCSGLSSDGISYIGPALMPETVPPEGDVLKNGGYYQQEVPAEGR